jgi:HK97 family phage major capsid protein
MSFDIKTLKERRDSLLVSMQTIAFHKEGWNADRRSKFDKINADVAALEEDISRAQTLANIETERSQFTRSPRGKIGDGSSVGSEHGEDSVAEQRTRQGEAFRQYARYGMSGVSSEYRDLLTTGSAGALIPQGFLPELIAAQKWAGPIAQAVKQKVTDSNGAPIKISLVNDTGNSLTLVGEGSSISEADPAFISKILGTDLVHGGLVKVSIQELEDSAFDLSTWLADAFGTRWARGIEKAVTLGVDGAGTVLPSQAAGGLLATATVAETTSTLAAGIGWTDLVAAYAALDPSYVQRATWVMNSQTRAYLIGLKDGFGKPYFENDPSNSAPFTRIMGFDILIDQAMPNMGANATPILFGSLTDSYLLRTDGTPQLVRLNERYMDTLEIGFFLYSRIGGCSLDAGVHPLMAVKQAAS